MTKQKIHLLLCISSLLVGGLLYALFREGSYIGVFAARFPLVITLRNIFGFLSCDFTKFYFPDFLWCFSLCCGLFAIFTPSLKGIVICVFIAILCGCIWELLQFLGCISGTGDLLDIIMYFLAGAICTIINMIRGNRNEES